MEHEPHHDTIASKAVQNKMWRNSDHLPASAQHQRDRGSRHWESHQPLKNRARYSPLTSLHHTPSHPEDIVLSTNLGPISVPWQSNRSHHHHHLHHNGWSTSTPLHRLVRSLTPTSRIPQDSLQRLVVNRFVISPYLLVLLPSRNQSLSTTSRR